MYLISGCCIWKRHPLTCDRALAPLHRILVPVAAETLAHGYGEIVILSSAHWLKHLVPTSGFTKSPNSEILLT